MKPSTLEKHTDGSEREQRLSMRSKMFSLDPSAKLSNKPVVVSHADGTSSHYTAKQATKSLKVLGKETHATNFGTQLIHYYEACARRYVELITSLC